MNREAAIRQLKKIKECAQKAGIEHTMFLGYGTCLGVVRENDFLGHDGDCDVCFLADKITKEQEDYYLELIRGCGASPVETPKGCDPHKVTNKGLYRHRERKKIRLDNNRVLWTSVKWELNGIKTCQWFQQRWNGFYWHSKGNRWISRIGRRLNLPIDYENTQAIMKGIPETYVEELKQVDIWGDKFRIPKMYGSALQFWYDDFMVPAKGKSAEKILCIVGKWEDKKTWKVMKMDKC